MTSRTTRTLGATLAACALVLGPAGCSGPSDTPQGGTSPSLSSSPVASASPSSTVSSSPSPKGSASAQPSASASATASPSQGAGKRGERPTIKPSEAVSSSSTPVATQSVAAPGGGDVKQTVPAATVTTPAAKPIEATVQPTQGVDVSITTKSVELKAKVPGDISGPGVLVTVTITNNGSSALGVDQTLVSLVDASGDVAPGFIGEPAKPLTGSLAPGKKASGSYAFGVDVQKRGKVRIEVRGHPSMGIAVYEGAVKA